MDVLERDDDALVGRNIHACNSGHVFTPVPTGAGAPDRVCLFRVLGRAFQAKATPTPALRGRHRSYCVRLNTPVIKGFFLTSSTSARAQLFGFFAAFEQPDEGQPSWRAYERLGRACAATTSSSPPV